MGDELKLVGVEIGWNVVRVCVLDSSGSSLEQYCDRINLSQDTDSQLYFLDPADAVRQAFKALDIVEGEYKIAVSIGPAFSGIHKIKSKSFFSEEIKGLESKSGLQIVSKENSSDVFTFVALDHLIVTSKAFELTGLELDRIELAPVAVARVLPNNFDGSFTLNSGTGWTTTVADGQLTEAIVDPEVLGQQVIKTFVKKKSSGKTLKKIEGVKIDKEFLDKHHLEIDSLFVCVGAAKGLLDSQDSSSLLGLVDSPSVSVDKSSDHDEDLEANAIEIESAEPIDPPVDLIDLNVNELGTEDEITVDQFNNKDIEIADDGTVKLSSLEEELLDDEEDPDDPDKKRRSGLFGKLRRGTVAKLSVFALFVAR